MSSSARRGRRRAPDPPDRAGADGGLASLPLDSATAPEADPYSVARTIVLNRLNSAPRTRAELAETLAKRDTPADIAEAVLDRMAEVGLVDDAAYARMWVESRQSGRGLARRALAHGLRQKGISDADAEMALEGIGEDVERAAAEDLVARKAKASHGLAREVRVRRLVGMLARKGYSSSLAYSVVTQVLDAEADATRV